MTEEISDLELVRKIVNENDSLAMKALFQKYKPMVNKLIANYYIKSFQIDDWEQEALIVCHESCFRFDGSLGSRFGSFYQLRLGNHFKSLLRKELTVKRRLDRVAVSLDRVSMDYEVKTDNSQLFAVQERITGYIGARQKSSLRIEDFTIDWEKFCEQLNELEIEVMLMLTGCVTMKEVCHRFNKNELQIKRVQCTCRNKLKKFLQ